MRVIRPSVMSGIAIWFAGSLALAQGVQQQIGMNGSVNFTRRIITATGIGIPGTAGGRTEILQAAKADALRNLLKVINGMALTSSLMVESQIQSSQAVKSRVEGIAKTYRQVGREKFYDDGSLEITVELNLDGPLLDAILPQRIGQDPVAVSPITGPDYTGLIVDATGLGARPALAPRILNEALREIYGSMRGADREWAVKYGMVGYERDPAAAKQSDRVGNRPLIVRGLRTTGPNAADIVISNDSARLLHPTPELMGVLEKCRVIIILD